MEGKRWTVAVDVDGVLHQYDGNWQGAEVLNGLPVPGAIKWLEIITEEYDVAICSTRCATPEGCLAIKLWLQKHGISPLALSRITVEAGKPPALLYVDDRGWRFDGINWPLPEDVRDASPWWRRCGCGGA